MDKKIIMESTISTYAESIESKTIYKFIKRTLDLILSIIGIIVTFPILLLFSTLIIIESSGPIIFKQARIGKNGKKFYIYKLRSMKTNAPNKSTDDFVDSHLYITKIGRFIRKTSIDELPQFINIIKGDMSIIGPRPVIESEFELLELRKLYNIDKITPGITGWAQINGRDCISTEKKVELDYYYYKNRSILLDIKIIIITIIKVLKSDDIK